MYRRDIVIYIEYISILWVRRERLGVWDEMVMTKRCWIVTLPSRWFRIYTIKRKIEYSMLLMLLYTHFWRKIYIFIYHYKYIFKIKIYTKIYCIYVCRIHISIYLSICIDTLPNPHIIILSQQIFQWTFSYSRWKWFLCFYLKRCPLFEISILELLKRFFLCIYFGFFIGTAKKKYKEIKKRKRSRSYLSCGWRSTVT